MCGICGIALSSRSNRSIDERLVARMRDVMTHRGPDGSGIFSENGIALGHRRLSIIDIAGGRQPMASGDGTLQIVYNGEIYNHSTLRSELEMRGAHYSSRCDTETVLHAYEAFGSRCTEQLRGMFAFAIWNRRTRELFLARDRFGVKPLYYVLASDGTLYFASEIKALLTARAVTPAMNLAALPDYLANHATSGDETLFEGVRRLPAGHTLLWRDGLVRIERYWDLSFKEQDTSAHDDDRMVREYADLFRESVRMRLMSDVPLGMFLSGGIDSAAITATMSQLVSEPIKTFSVAFAEREANELAYARMVAERYRTDHHEVVVSPEEFFSAMPRLVWHEDEPMAHPSSVALYFVSRLASDHVKVVLTGEGSDEMLAGYGRYRTTIYNLLIGARYARVTTRGMRDVIRRIVSSLPAGSRTSQRLSRTFLTRPADLDNLYFDNFAVFSREAQRTLLAPAVREMVRGIDPYTAAHAALKDFDGSSRLSQLLYADSKTYLHELLMKQDQMSMAASIESRVPFLDHPLAEFSAHLPDRMKLRGLTTKYVLRRAMKDALPEEILSRGKMGFPVPVGAWFRGPYRHVVDEYVLGDRAAARGLFDRRYLREIVSSHANGTHNHSESLWSLVNLEVWHRLFIDGEAIAGVNGEAELAPARRPLAAHKGRV
ncbi:MAG: asparagine synthase (glutamine-hydrolyzing) [Gemmatimonadaceae bacterium]